MGFRRFGRTYVLLACLMALGHGKQPVAIAAGPNAAVPPPNVILMMADDMGMGDTSAYQVQTGNADQDQLLTPNMERLARMGIRFTDAHTPTSRCSGTRYGLLTGRYPWRNRLKHWVLFGAQGDPMIETDRPTIASLLKSQGYGTGMVGKWHVGLRYRNAAGKPAAGWNDADLSQPLWDSPIDHGFDFARFTSRSHGTSGPNAGAPNPQTQRKNGPGHVDGRRSLSATGRDKNLVLEGPNAYVLAKLGSRHCRNALEFLNQHVQDSTSSDRPFFLYYAANANHGPYTPDASIMGRKVAGAARSVSGTPMGKRYDFIYENDVALGILMDWLSKTDDPRNPSQKLIRNTLVIFTSDNGAEVKAKTATGPFRSNKGSAYEGGHRVPFIAAWPEGAVGDGDDTSVGRTSHFRVGLQDLFATLSEIVDQPLPDLRSGEKGAEDSHSFFDALQGKQAAATHPIFHNDHNEADDKAACAIRVDNPTVDGQLHRGQWKLFFDGDLVRFGKAKPTELYNLSADPREEHNLIAEAACTTLVDELSRLAVLHRNSGGHRYAADFPDGAAVTVDFAKDSSRAAEQSDASTLVYAVPIPEASDELTVHVQGSRPLSVSSVTGLGVTGAKENLVDDGESLKISFDADVLLESLAIEAGQGTCGGFYRVGDGVALAVYCIDGDNDAKDQHGHLSDLGVLRAGQTLHLDSSTHFGCEPAGAWSLRAMRVRPLP